MKSQPSQSNKKASHQRSTQKHWNEMNRKQRREIIRKMQSEDLSLDVVHPDAAGVDIGNEVHYVAVPPSRSSAAVRRFGCTTAELNDPRLEAEGFRGCRLEIDRRRRFARPLVR